VGFSSSARFVDGGDLTPRPDCEATEEGCSMDGGALDLQPSVGVQKCAWLPCQFC
jgi:hypothetical protein